jgi:hypothetical protein
MAAKESEEIIQALKQELVAVTADSITIKNELNKLKKKDI